jgi:hypothetical protein
MRPSGWHFRESILTAALLVASAANAHAEQNHAFGVCKMGAQALSQICSWMIEAAIPALSQNDAES